MPTLVIDKRWFLSLALLFNLSAAFSQYHITGFSPVWSGRSYGPYTISGGTWSTADHWCVVGGTLNGTSNTCMANQGTPSVSVTWNAGAGTGVLSYYVGSSTSPAATYAVNVYSITNLVDNNNAEFAPDNFPFVPIGQFYSVNLTANDASIPGTSISYNWLSSTDGTNYSPLPNNSTKNYLFNRVFTQNVWVRRDVTITDPIAGLNSSSSNVTMITAVPAVVAGTVTQAYQIVSAGNSPLALAATASTGGTMCGGNYTYTWQTSTDNATWTNAGSGLSFAPGAINAKTYIRQMANCGPVAAITNTVIVDVYGPLNGGLIGPMNITIPGNTSPGTLTGNPASGGNTSQPYVYQWQYSADPSFPSGSTTYLAPSVSALTYTVGILSATTYFRRAVTCNGQTAYSNTATVQIGTLSAGNYIRSRLITAPGMTTASQADGLTALSDVKQSTNYFDGLGRLTETVAMKGAMVTAPTPTPTDLVTFYQYDVEGREAMKYLPYVSAAADGNLKTNPFPEQNAYNSAQFPNEKYNYGQINFEASPLDRINNSSAPGISWTGSGRSNQHIYAGNTPADLVVIWNVTNSGSVGTFGSYAFSGYYPAGALFKEINLDENNKQVIEFKDKSGNTILKKVQLTATGDDGGGTGYSGWLSTYYIYDNWGNLRCVIQPRGVELLLQNSYDLTALGNVILNEQCFRYEYDQRNRMIMKKLPGATEVYLVYDAIDRPVATQDAVLRPSGKWLVTFYDALDRPIETGMFVTNTSLTSTMSWAMSSPVFPFALTSPPSYPTYELLTYNHYDDYSGIPTELSGTLNTSTITLSNFYSSYNVSPIYAQPLTQITPTTTISTKGLVTWTQAEVLGSGDAQYISTADIYDNRGRVIQQQVINYSKALDIATTQYDFSGKPLIGDLRHQKNVLPATVQTYEVVTRNSYDDLGRPTKKEKMLITTLVGSPAWKTISTMAYDGLGRLATKTIGNNPSNTGPLETQAYEYNIRGWLLGINRNFINSTSPSNYFGFELGYDKANTIVSPTTYASQQFNGNIEGMIWKNGGDGAVRKYDFNYDPVNRLTAADFNQYNSAFNKNDGLDFSVNNLTYDANGNIIRMKQMGWKASGSVPIDDLTYTYALNSNTNRLQNVIDAANDPTTVLGDFRYSTTYLGQLGGTKTTSATDYSYDVNGNLTADKNKDITSISYNYLNLPQTITTAKGTISYLYDATGSKLAKTTSEPTGFVLGIQGSIITTTTYIAGFVYQSVQYGASSLAPQQYTDNLQFFEHEEGRVRGLYTNATSPTILNGFAFDYFLKDHLGNTRVLLTEEQQTDSYPTLTFEGTTTSDVANQNAIWDNYQGSAINVLGNRATLPVGFSSANNGTYSGSITKASGAIGAAKLIKVMSGDVLNVSIDYVYNSAADNSTANGLNTLVTSLASMIMGSGEVNAFLKGQAATIASNAGTNAGVMGFFGPEGPSSVPGAPPKAYLHILLFNNQFVFDNVNSVVMPITSAGLNVRQTFTKANMAIAKSGYAYIYFSNETNSVVYFDNFALTHVRGAILETNDYYPFGLSMAGITDKALKSQYAENKYRFSGKEIQHQEFSDGTGLEEYDYGQRFQDLQLGRWWMIDPLADKMRRFSPYNFAFNNPIRFVDPDGMGPNDVILGGADKQIAFVELQKSVQGQLNLSMDANGKVSYTQTDPKAKLGSDAKQLTNAINDHSITVNVDATNNKTTSTGNLFIGGAFGGNTVAPPMEPAGKDTKPNVVANQEINPTVLGAADAPYGKPGANTLHEVTEAYQGAKLSQASGTSSGNASAPGSVYSAAHAAATPQAGPIYQTAYDAKGNILSAPFTGTVRATYTVQPANQKPIVIMTIP